MKVKRLILGNLQTNGYVISNDNNECIIIDPGDNGKKVLTYIENAELEVKAILLTHGHFDHIGAVDYIYERFMCPIYIHQEDEVLINDPKYNLSSMMGNSMVLKAPICYPEEQMELIGLLITWLHLPGHCPGSSMIYLKEEGVIFSGDVLFQGSIGRFDFPLSSNHDTKLSLQYIKEMEEDAIVYPGHGESTTLYQEQQTNPYLVK